MANTSQKRKSGPHNYTERLQSYFSANSAADNKRKDTLFSICGAATYKLVRNLAVPRKPTELTFKGVVDLVQTHYSPKPPVIIQRFKFNTRSQEPGESVANFVASLRAIAQFCEYNALLDEMIRDRLVCGISKTSIIQRRLLSENDLTLQKAIDLAIGMEIADKNAWDLQKPESTNHVYKIDHKNRSQPVLEGVKCYRCGGNHKAPQCRFKEAICHACKKRGHLAKVHVCMTSQRKPQKKVIHEVEDEGLPVLQLTTLSGSVKPLKTINSM